MGTFTNSEDPDEMLHNAAFHQGLHSVCLLRLKRSSDKKKLIFLNYNRTSIDVYKGLSQIYCTNQKEESISMKKV